MCGKGSHIEKASRFYKSGGKMTHLLGYFGRPSWPSNICTCINQHCSQTSEHALMLAILSMCPSRSGRNGKSYLPQPLVLAQCPLCHGKRACCNEKEGCNCLSGNSKKDPAIYLEGVVGTGDIVEGKALWNDVFLGACWPQISQNQMTSANMQTHYSKQTTAKCNADCAA